MTPDNLEELLADVQGAAPEVGEMSCSWGSGSMSMSALCQGRLRRSMCLMGTRITCILQAGCPRRCELDEIEKRRRNAVYQLGRDATRHLRTHCKIGA